MSSTEKLEIEKSMSELQGMVEALESQELTLEDSMKTFEAGVGLIRRSHAHLSEVEQRVNLLTEVRDSSPSQDNTSEPGE